MNEEIEYAEMLEIPVSTVNVIRKKQRKNRLENLFHSPSSEASAPPTATDPLLKDDVISQVNNRVSADCAEAEPLQVEPDLFAESVNSEGRLDFDPIPERIDTVRLYSTEETNGFFNDRLHPQDFPLNDENGGTMYAMNRKKGSRGVLNIVLNAEFAAACALCGAIFLTNVFVPHSAINTFFRAINTPQGTETNSRPYTDFTLSPVVSENGNAELTLSPSGILSFTSACCVYPAANGTLTEITKSADGLQSVKIEYSSSFTGIISGLDYVYYAVGDEVKANVPIGYTNGEEEVQVTMYSSGALLNCFQLTEENCLAWIEKTEE